MTDHRRTLSPASATYEAAGVDSRTEESALAALKEIISRTFSLASPGGKPRLPLGYFANVLELDSKTGLAISTDGVGTKVLVAQRAGRYDTIGIDCVAVNVNDLLCVGARPTAMVDYVAVERLEEHVMAQIAQGLYEGARQARISIPGGEIAQMADCIRGHAPGSGLDLVGTAVGLVDLDKVLIGDNLAEGDAVVGLASSGLHSNGFTLARQVLFDVQRWDVDTEVPELAGTLGDALLRPTRIYVPEVLEMLQANLRIKALIHMSGDGFLNLLRVAAPAGFVIDSLPQPPAIFRVVQEAGRIRNAEMFHVFNMGVGFCVIVDPRDADAVNSVAGRHGVKSHLLGRVTLSAADRGKVRILPYRVVGDAASASFQPA